MFINIQDLDLIKHKNLIFISYNEVCILKHCSRTINYRNDDCITSISFELKLVIVEAE